MRKLTLYIAAKIDSNRLQHVIDEVQYTVSKYANINLSVTTVPIVKTAILWTNCGERVNDRTGGLSPYCDIDSGWFSVRFHGSDIIGAVFGRDTWNDGKPVDYVEVGTTVASSVPSFGCTIPDGAQYLLSAPQNILVDPLSWIILHELSHLFFKQMQVPDVTHIYDYRFQDLLGAIVQWKDVQPTLLQQLLAALKALVPLYQKQIDALTTMPKPTSSNIAAWAKAIQNHEGWKPGSRSYRNNNPGNFRYNAFVATLGATKQDTGGFAIFPSYDAGFNGLCKFLTECAQDQIRGYHGDPTLYQFFAVYAPSSDNNNPKAYAEAVAKQIGVSPNARISTLL